MTNELSSARAHEHAHKQQIDSCQLQPVIDSENSKTEHE